MFTSRAEFRLSLRQDNADERLMAVGCRFGLVDPLAWEYVQRRVEQVGRVVNHLERRAFPSRSGNARFETCGLDPVAKQMSLGQVLRRPEVRFAHVRPLVESFEEIDEALDGHIESALKYDGYIRRQARDVEAMRKLDSRSIPDSFAYEDIPGLSAEARQKLIEKRPETVGQASRISGVRAADLSIVAVFLERHRRDRSHITTSD
jgi:tRNA uridine 5-carboxymethylaminomethyl modification enzyme